VVPLEILFIDARKLGHLVDRTRRELSDEDIAKVAQTYHAWRGEPEARAYEDVPGLCKAATLEEVRSHNHILTPGRYVGAEDADGGDEAFDEKMQMLVAKLNQQRADAEALDRTITTSLRGLGYGI